MAELVIKSPATGAEVGRAPILSPAEVDAAVARARVASGPWGAMTFAQRSEALSDFRRALANAADELAELLSAENGKPLAESYVELIATLSHVGHAATRAEKALAPRKVSPGILANFRATISYAPLGVIGVIGPWNYPVQTPVGSIAYALAAGNAVVWKPSELTPLIAVRIAEIAAATLPVRDTLQVVTGAGETGAALARAAVDKIAFTGSAATGKRVMMAAAERLTPVLLELGGKDPMIVTDDADLEKAAEACVFGGLTNNGQACVSIERVYVAAAVHDKFVDELAKQVRELKPGAAGNDSADFGAMTSPGQVKIVRDHLEDAIAKGAKVIVGGPSEIEGNYIKPTILTNVDHTMKIMVEETFGPVIPVAKVNSLDEAVRLANDSKFGLGSSVFAGSQARAIADRIRAGMTSVNSVMGFAGIPSLPFGGVGDSGFGRIHGDEGLREFSRVKSTAEQTMSLPINMMTFRQPKNAVQRLKGMIHQVYGDGTVARVQDLVRKWL
ncbi:MAG TPA: aldehyde dehydrogenase family protein [Kofleriaceae bacterium]|nr:aldehyde dehydrogenase family protein [Kofleriaceae bacterium]